MPKGELGEATASVSPIKIHGGVERPLAQQHDAISSAAHFGPLAAASGETRLQRIV
jgi:hypothetical protein